MKVTFIHSIVYEWHSFKNVSDVKVQVEMTGEMHKRVLVGNPKGRRPIGGSGSRIENNIETA